MSQFGVEVGAGGQSDEWLAAAGRLAMQPTGGLADELSVGWNEDCLCQAITFLCVKAFACTPVQA